MTKIINHIKNNAILYLIIVLCLVILAIAIFMKAEPKKEILDTKHFKVVTLDEALKLFDDDSPKYLLISTNTCTATIGFSPTLIIAGAKAGITIHYLELNDIDKSNKEVMAKFYEFQRKLDIEYSLKDETKKLGEFIGTTPMNVIIKNKKVAFAYIGAMSQDTTYAVMTRYM